MSYITKDDATKSAASLMRMRGAESLPAHWGPQIDAALERSYQVIREALIGRGFTAAQVDAWDARRVYQRQIMICYLFENGGLPDDFSGSQSLDRACKMLEQLQTCQVIVSGVLVVPAGTSAGVGYGDSTDDDDEDGHITMDTVL